MRLWRISNFADLSGRGGLLAAARWNRIGVPIVYCADHPASAVLEILVHVDAEDLPATYQLLEIEAPETAQIWMADLPSDWAGNLDLTRQIGSDFIADGKYPLMRAPSAIVPHAVNFLLNPMLSERAGIRIVAATQHAFDARLLG